MEIILAIRATFHSGRIRRRLPATVCFGSPSSDRRCAAFFRSAPGVSSKRPAANSPPLAAGGNWCRCRAWFSFGPNWNRRRNISHAANAVLSMGTHSPGRSCFSVVHLGKLDRRAGWLLYKSSFNSFARSHPRSGCDHWRRRGIAFGQQAFCCPGDFAFIGDSPSYRRDEIAFHEIGRRAAASRRGADIFFALKAPPHVTLGQRPRMLKRRTASAESAIHVMGIGSRLQRVIFVVRLYPWGSASGCRLNAAPLALTRYRRPYPNFNFGAVSGDHGLVL